MSKSHIAYSFFLLLIGLFISNYLSAQKVSDFDISYPYSKDANNLQIDDLGYIWFYDYDDLYLFNGHQTKPFHLPELAATNKFDYDLKGIINLDNEQFLLSINRQLSLIDIVTKEIKPIWKLPQQHQLDYTYKDENNHIWVFTINQVNQSRPAFKLDQNYQAEIIFDLEPYIKEKRYYWNYSFAPKGNQFFFTGVYGDMFIINHNGEEENLEVANEIDFESKKACYVFRVDNKGNLWRIKHDVFEIYNPQKKIFEQHPISGKILVGDECLGGDKKGRRLSQILINQENDIWLGFSTSSLFLYQKEKDQIINFRSELVRELGGGFGDIKHLKEDKDGNIWGMKRNGIFKITKKKQYFERYLLDTDNQDHLLYENQKNPFINTVIDHFEEEGISKASICGLNEDDNGVLYFQDFRFSYRLKKDDTTIEILPFFNGSGKNEVYMDKDVKIHTTWDNYYTFDSTFILSRKNAPLKAIYKFHRSKNGDFWVAGRKNENDYLFAKLNPNNYEFEGNYKDPRGLFDFEKASITDIDEDEDGNLWLGTNTGIIKINENEGFLLRIVDSLDFNGDKVDLHTGSTQIQYYKDHLIWFRNKFQLGLLNVNNNSIKYLVTRDELNVDVFEEMLPMGDTAVWFGDSDGLNYYHFKEEKLTKFSKKDGIDINRSIREMILLQDGRIAAGTNNGLYLFHPDTLLQKHRLKEVEEIQTLIQLNSYSILNGEDDSIYVHDFLMKQNHKIELDYNDKMLNLEFAILNFSSNKQHTYSYFLEGYDSKWSPPIKENTIKYTSLPTGKYILKVKGAPSGDIWSNQILSIPIIVHQAWFRTWWFYLGSLFVIFSIITLFIRNYFKQQLEKRLAIERLRTKISSDLHDDVGSILTGLAMQTEILEYTAEDKDRKQLSRISELSRSAMSRMRDAVWAMDARKDNWKALIDRMNEFTAETLEVKNIEHQLNIEGIELEQDIATEMRQNLYLITKEAITNIIKHSNASLVNIHLKKEKGFIELSIHDNGIPLKKKHKSAGLGMSNMKMRAEQINALLSIKQDDGFTVFLRLKEK